MVSEIPETFCAFGPQLNTFMSVGILLEYFRRLKLLKFEQSKTVWNFKTPTRTMQITTLCK